MNTIQELMAAVGYEKWPAYWNDICDEAMTGYEKHGCRLTDPNFYVRLGEACDCFPYGTEAFEIAAAEIGKDPVLARFLALLDLANQNRDLVHKECKLISAVPVVDGRSELAAKMVLALALLGTVEYTAKLCDHMALPADRTLYLIQAVSRSVHNYQEKHDGQIGFSGVYWWFQLYVDAYLYDFGCLTLDLSGGREGLSRVYINEAGEQAVLVDGLRIHRSGRPLGSAGCEDEEGSWMADIVETEDSYAGYAVLPDGLVADYPINLVKSRWKELLGPNDRVMRLHIPAKAKFDPESVDSALRQIVVFVNEHFKDMTKLIFSCNSWMLDPQLKKLLSSKSNIIHFQKRFRTMPRISSAQAVFHFIFNRKGIKPEEIADLPRDSSLQKGIVEHYLAGKYIYETCGYFLYDPSKSNSRLNDDPKLAPRDSTIPFPAKVDLVRLEDRIEAFEEKPILTGKILFYGDSGFTRWGPQRGFRPMAEDLCAKDGSVAVVNHGFGTSTAEEQLYYYDRAVKPWKPRAIVLKAGGNDIGAGYTLEEIVYLQARLFERARQDFPGIRLFLCDQMMGIRHIHNTEIHEKWRKLSALRKAYCAEHEDCTLLEFVNSPLFFNSPEDVGKYECVRPDIFVGDGGHFNQKGYDLFKQFFQNALSDIL